MFPIDEYVQTKLFGLLFTIFIFGCVIYLSYRAGEASGYRSGLSDNSHPKEIHTYVYADGRLLRFDPSAQTPFIIDLKKNSITFVPINKDVNPKSKGDTDDDN